MEKATRLPRPRSTLHNAKIRLGLGSVADYSQSPAQGSKTKKSPVSSKSMSKSATTQSKSESPKSLPTKDHSVTPFPSPISSLNKELPSLPVARVGEPSNEMNRTILDASEVMTPDIPALSPERRIMSESAAADRRNAKKPSYQDHLRRAQTFTRDGFATTETPSSIEITPSKTSTTKSRLPRPSLAVHVPTSDNQKVTPIRGMRTGRPSTSPLAAETDLDAKILPPSPSSNYSDELSSSLADSAPCQPISGGPVSDSLTDLIPDRDEPTAESNEAPTTPTRGTFNTGKGFVSRIVKHLSHGVMIPGPDSLGIRSTLSISPSAHKFIMGEDDANSMSQEDPAETSPMNDLPTENGHPIHSNSNEDVLARLHDSPTPQPRVLNQQPRSHVDSTSMSLKEMHRSIALAMLEGTHPNSMPIRNDTPRGPSNPSCKFRMISTHLETLIEDPVACERESQCTTPEDLMANLESETELTAGRESDDVEFDPREFTAVSTPHINRVRHMSHHSSNSSALRVPPPDPPAVTPLKAAGSTPPSSRIPTSTQAATSLTHAPTSHSTIGRATTVRSTNRAVSTPTIPSPLRNELSRNAVTRPNGLIRRIFHHNQPREIANFTNLAANALSVMQNVPNAVRLNGNLNFQREVLERSERLSGLIDTVGEQKSDSLKCDWEARRSLIIFSAGLMSLQAETEKLNMLLSKV